MVRVEQDAAQVEVALDVTWIEFERAPEGLLGAGMIARFEP